MSLAAQVTLLAQRIATEFKSVRTGDASWTTATLTNSFVAFVSSPAGVWGTPKFRKNGLGEVKLFGLVTLPGGSSSNQNIFTLPAGYRPGARIIVPVTRGTSGVETLQINSDNGAVYMPNIAASATGYVSLSGITFLAEN